MTTITSTWNYTCAICDKVGSFFKRTFKNYQFARQMAAIKTDKTMYVWGWHGQNGGNLGLNQPNTTMISSPTQLPGQWRYASQGDYFAGYITDI